MICLYLISVAMQHFSFKMTSFALKRLQNYLQSLLPGVQGIVKLVDPRNHTEFQITTNTFMPLTNNPTSTDAMEFCFHLVEMHVGKV